MQLRELEQLTQELAMYKNQVEAFCDQGGPQEDRPMGQRIEQGEKSLRKALIPTIHPSSGQT